ncbi:MAG: hypothetical protein SGBAC_010545 [Bacillariaceae sp.]
MKRLAIAAILGWLCHVCLAECRSFRIKGANGSSIPRSQPIDYIERQLGVGPRPVDDEPTNGDGKSTKDKIDSGNQGNPDDEREGNTGGSGGGDPILLQPTLPPTIRPTIVSTMTLATPTALPTDTSSESPTALPSDSPSASPSASTVLAETPTRILPTSSPSKLGTNSGAITRNLLPFDITVQGEESELRMVQIPLELSINEFLSEKMDGSFDSFTDISLSTTELGTIQRQAARRTFGFTGDAKFDGVNVPTFKEVQDVQQRALSEFSFELQDILNERNVPVNVVDVSIDDEDGSSNQQGGGGSWDNSEDTSSARGGIEIQIDEPPSESQSVAIGVGVAVSVLVLVCVIVVYLQQRKPKIEDNKELEFLDDPDFMDDPDFEGGAPVDHMIDTSAGQSPSLVTGEYA